MKIVDALKIVWRSILRIQEEKQTFFRRDRRLVNGKKWDYLFRASYGKGVEMIFFDSEKELLWLEKDGIQIITDDDYSVFLEILVDKAYMLPPQLTGDFCVFDVGMNRGLASLFFAKQPTCKRVFGFELSPKTFEWALQNFALNSDLKEKITPHNFGLWAENGQVDICDCSKADGNTCISSCVSEQDYLRSKMQNKNHLVAKADVKKSSAVFSSLIDERKPDEKKVLKIDIEGAEYVVFEDLYKHNVLQQFDVIIGEAHNGLAGLEKYLDNFVCVYKNELTPLLVMFCYLNKKLS